MKVLSDFDGVMTDQTEEARVQQSLMRERLLELGLGAGEVAGFWARADAALQAQPRAQGWWSEGRLSAYSDEDCFVYVHGQAALFDAWAAAGEADLRAAQARLEDAGLRSFTGLAVWAYHAMTQRTGRGEIKPMDPVVGDVLRTLLQAGHQVVVVSNSSTARIIDLLRTVGLAAVAHADVPDAALRVRGGARKFALSSTPEALEVDGIAFQVDRPSYRAIVEEERADVVIGDVFSLDLALPLHLARRRGDDHHVTLLLRARPYTPSWARALCAGQREPGATRAAVAAFEELVDVAERRP